ncbi:MAG: glutamyl-tRNA reductase [Mycobacteriales bacterium]
MSILAVGLSHRSASLPLLERVTAGLPDPGKVLRELVSGEHVVEAALLTTCNRVELYASATTFHGGVAELTDALARSSGVALEELSDSLYVHHDARAVQHLFSVAAGLDSMLVGESQILGQLRTAFRQAQEEGGVGRTLGELFRHALRVGKKVRTDTGIDRAGASLVSAGIQLAAPALAASGLAGCRAVIIGAGATAALAGQTLVRAGARGIQVLNRSPHRATRLAHALGGRAGGLSELSAALGAADLVISATASSGLVLTRADVAAAVLARDGRPLVLLDLALPHDIDPGVRDLPGVTLVDLAALRGVADTFEGGQEVEAARRIVAEEVGVFLGWQRSMRVAPTVVALRAKADALADAELDRLLARLPDLDERSRGEVRATVRRVVDKLLHAPTVRVKELAESPGGDSYAEALRELFGLDRKAAEALSTPEAEGTPDVEADQ